MKNINTHGFDPPCIVVPVAMDILQKVFKGQGVLAVVRKGSLDLDDFVCTQVVHTMLSSESWVRLRFVVFLAVHNSSIGDLVTN